MVRDLVDTDLLASLKSCWQALEKQHDRLSALPSIEESDEAEYQKTKNAVIERFERLLASNAGEDMPEDLRLLFEKLSRFSSIRVLPDNQMDDMHRVMRDINLLLNQWLNAVNRKAVVAKTLNTKQRRIAINRFFVVPLIFGLLVVLLVWIGAYFYFDR